MKSPFPGMDPWLEQHWGDVHQRLITYAADALRESLPDGLRARMQERLAVQQVGETQRNIYPDVNITTDPRAKRPQPETGAVATLEPEAGVEVYTIVVRHEPVPQSFIEIIDPRSNGKVITIIEFLSPVNKTEGPGRDLYKQKQREAQQAGIHLVEVDLLRAGEWTIAAGPEQIPEHHRTDPYYISIWRNTERDRATLYCIPMAARLPAIPIPLRPGDPEVKLDLQELLEKAYRNGGYDTINYAHPPLPPLQPYEQDWVREVLSRQVQSS